MLPRTPTPIPSDAVTFSCGNGENPAASRSTHLDLRALPLSFNAADLKHLLAKVWRQRCCQYGALDGMR